MLAAIYACLGNVQGAKEALAIVLKDTPGESLSEVRRKLGKIWTAPGSLERWIDHMRIAGVPE